jgi:hypothetical protein
MTDEPNDFDEWVVTKVILGIVIIGGVWMFMALIGVV